MQNEERNCLSLVPWPTNFDHLPVQHGQTHILEEQTQQCSSRPTVKACLSNSGSCLVSRGRKGDLEVLVWRGGISRGHLLSLDLGVNGAALAERGEMADARRPFVAGTALFCKGVNEGESTLKRLPVAPLQKLVCVEFCNKLAS